MFAVALLAAVLGQDICLPALREARALALVRDTDGALARLNAAGTAGCDVEVPSAFLQGLVEGRRAAARGGDDASLEPLQVHLAAIQRRAMPGSAEEIAALVLRAAVAAAQSERDELFAYLSQALQVERSRGARGLPGAPVLSAHEVAGELWLDVHRYDDAVAAFRIARGAAGDSPRLTSGLARALAGRQAMREACSEYQRLAADPDARRPSMVPELAEAERVLAQPSCRPPSAR